jgi:sugar/nucleoside kinase (ribokinase family)
LNPIQLAQKLALLPAERWKQLSFLVGFDGFTDCLLGVVKTRLSPDNFIPIHTIGDFASRIAEAAGKGANFELVTKTRKIGGNGPILASALSEMGCEPRLIGTLGFPQVEPLFTPLAKRCKHVISYAPSAETDAIEFEDGKIMLGKHENILHVNLKEALTRLPEDTLISYFNEADIVAATNWTMIFGMTEFWHYLIEKIAPRIEARKRIFFVDFADPSKRTQEDLHAALGALKKMRIYYRVILGVNEREAQALASLFGVRPGEREDLLTFTRTLSNACAVDGVVLHTISDAYASIDGATACVKGPYCSSPKITTGGGDNFNAGFLLGLALEASLIEALTLAVATSGYYVRHGKSPNRQELIDFLTLSFS